MKSFLIRVTNRKGDSLFVESCRAVKKKAVPDAVKVTVIGQQKAKRYFSREEAESIGKRIEASYVRFAVTCAVEECIDET